MECLSWKNINSTSNDSETNNDLSQTSLQTNTYSSNIFRPSTEIRNRKQVSFRSYLEKDLMNSINSFEICKSDQFNQYEEENTQNSESYSHETEFMNEINNMKTNIRASKGLPPPPPTMKSSRENVQVPLSTHLRDTAQTSMYPTFLDKSHCKDSSSPDNFGEYNTNAFNFKLEIEETSEVIDSNTVQDRSNIISVKGLPPPPPKPPRIFLSSKEQSNITLDNIVATNYE